MSQQTWVENLITNQVDGTAWATVTTPSSILTPNPQLWFPSNYFTTIGKALRIKAMGRVSNIVTTPGTLKLDVMMGPSSPPSINVFTGGAMALNIVAKTNVTWYMEAILIVRAVGAAALTTFMGMGQWESESAIGTPAGASGAVSLPASAPVVGSGINNSVPNVLDLFATWSLTGNTIQMHNFLVEALN
jgi:hypothetical protein